MKATIEQLKESYERLGNIWQVAEEFGMCGQSVWERLKRHNFLNDKNYYSNEENKKIIAAYANFEKGNGITEFLVLELKRDRHSICRQARKLGLTNLKRKLSKKSKDLMAISKKKWYQSHVHPKGMLGKNHSPEYCEKISARVKKWHKDATPEMRRTRTKKSLATRLENHGTLAPCYEGGERTWKQGWRNIGGKDKYYRSRWEANYARYLQWQLEQRMIKAWEHEPQTFWFSEIKRGCLTYLPDFRVENLDGTHLWIEVKGWMCPRSKTKIKRFKKYYPEEQLKIIDGKWFKECSKNISIVIKDWE